MLNGVNDVVTPWTSSRILRIMEAAAVSRTPGRGDADRAASSFSDDSAVAMERLLHLSNQQPDVAGRVMTAPLFAQRPLVEATEPASNAASSSPPLCFSDAHRMCTHTLDRCRAGWRGTVASLSAQGHNEELKDRLPPALSAASASLPPYSTLSELEEVAFAAEFAEPCLRGNFPDVAAVVHRLLPVGCASVLQETSEADVRDRRGVRGSGTLHGALQSLLQVPAVAHRVPPDDDGDEEDDDDGGPPTAVPSSSLRLNLSRPSPAVASNALLWSSLPPPSAVPLEAHGPPAHMVFDKAVLAHTFSNAEVSDLCAFFSGKPRPFQVFSKAEVKARRHQTNQPQRRSALLSAGSGGAPLSGVRGSTTVRHAAVQRSSGPVSRGADEEQDGWSASSGWSSNSEHGNSDAEDHTGGGSAADEPGLLRSTSVEKELPMSKSSLANRTWVEDDGDLIMENGKFSLRKRKVRVTKKPLPLLRLPIMKSGPVLGHFKTAAEARPPVTVISVDGRGGEEPLPGVSNNSAPERNVEEIIDVKEEVETLAMRRKAAGVKRGRAADEEKENSTPPSPANARKRSKLAASKKASGRKATTAAGGATSSASTQNLATVPCLSGSEIVELVGRLPISDHLRSALLIGVQTASVAGKADVEDSGEKSFTSGESNA